MADTRVETIWDAILARLAAVYDAGTVTTTVGAGVGVTVEVVDSSALKVGFRVKFDGATERRVKSKPDATHVELDASVSWSPGQAVTQSTVAQVLDYERPGRDIGVWPEWQCVLVEEDKPPNRRSELPICQVLAQARFVVKTFAKETDAVSADRQAVRLGGTIESELASRAEPAPTFLGLGYVRGVFVVRNRLAYTSKELARNMSVLLSAVEVEYRHDTADPFDAG